MKHYLYKTTNLLNNRFYVGMHSTKNPDDGYLGSGRRIKAEIKKYGRENFKKEILEELPSREALENREAELVNEELISNPLCLNLKNGGEGGGQKWSDEAQFKWSSAGGKACFKKQENLDAHRKRSSERLKQLHAEGKLRHDTFTGRKHSEETKAKMRLARQRRKNIVPVV